MTRTLICLFGTTMFLLTSNTFAGDRSRGCRSSCPQVNCVTTVSNGCGCCSISCSPVACVTAPGCGNGCSSCDACQNGVVYETDGGYGNDGGDQNNNGGKGNNGGNDSPLDPDVLSRLDGQQQQLVSTLQRQRNANTERIWTDSSGQYKRLARFVRMEGTQVILMNAQGRTTRIDVLILSAADQLLANQLSKESTPGPLPTDHENRIAGRP